MVHARQVGGQIFPHSHALGFPGAGGAVISLPPQMSSPSPTWHRSHRNDTDAVGPLAHGNFAGQHSGSIRRHERSLQRRRVCLVSSVHSGTFCTVKGVLGWGYTWINALFKFDVFFVCTKKGRGEL